MLYFATGVKELYLSQTALRELGVIEADFPTVGKYSGRRTTGRRSRSTSASPPLTGRGSTGDCRGLGNLGGPGWASGMSSDVVCYVSDDVFPSEPGEPVARVDAEERRLAACGCLA